MLVWLTLACTKSSKEVEKTPAEVTRFTQAALEALGAPKDSICRGLVPPDVTTKGCTVVGPYQGILEGDKLSDELTLTQAIETCIANPKCTGVSTEWYADTPFVAVQNTGRFSVDSDSYGCTFIVSCSE